MVMGPLKQSFVAEQMIRSHLQILDLLCTDCLFLGHAAPSSTTSRSALCIWPTWLNIFLSSEIKHIWGFLNFRAKSWPERPYVNRPLSPSTRFYILPTDFVYYQHISAHRTVSDAEELCSNYLQS